MENQSTEVVSSNILIGCLEAAQELGIDSQPLLSEHGIDPRLLDSPGHYLSKAQVAKYLHEAAYRFDHPNFGFLVGKHQPPLQFGQAAQLLRLAPDLQTALHNVGTFERIYVRGTRHALHVENGVGQFRRWDVAHYDFSLLQLRLLGMVQVYKMFKALCGESWRPISLDFSLSEPVNTLQLNEYFRCPVRLGQRFDCLVFPAKDLSIPISTGDAELLEIVEEHFLNRLSVQYPQTNPLSRAKDFILHNIGTNRCTMDGCAQFLAMHPRALQRELLKQGCSFKQLLLDARMEMAKHYLEDPNSNLMEIASKLGYRNQSAFSRAFKATQNISPRQWIINRSRTGTE